MATLIKGKEISSACREKIKAEVAQLTSQGLQPGLAVVLVGDDSGSHVYVNNKKKACTELGIYSEVYELPEQTTEQALLELIAKLSQRAEIHGILVQLPLPKHINEQTVLGAIPPMKDVDAFHPQNVGHIMIGDYRFLPCTPAGIIEMLDFAGIECEGKNCVIVGRSNIVGKPMAMLMLQKNATVTVCHSKTKNLAEITRNADILIVAIGKAKFISADMVKAGAVVVDVGMNRDSNNKLCGDVDFESVEPIASYITPVPGGVGPMTITMLMKNTVTAAKLSHKE